MSWPLQNEQNDSEWGRGARNKLHTHTHTHIEGESEPGLSAADRQVHNFVTLIISVVYPLTAAKLNTQHKHP